MKDLQENIISSVNQNKYDTYIYGDKGFKVLFAGNSITRHGLKPEVGWNRECGMAASSVEKDYVHLFMKKVREEYRSDASFAIAQVANYERSLNAEALKTYEFAKEYKPDVLIMFFGANVSKDHDTDPALTEKFRAAYEDMRNYLKSENTLVFHSQGFYIRPVLDEQKEKIAKKYGDTFINIENIRNREETHGMFNHPGDLGMEEIADAFWKAVKPLLPPVGDK